MSKCWRSDYFKSVIRILNNKLKSFILINFSAIIFLPWSFKIFYAIFTDCFRPFGLRRKPYLIAGWIGVLTFTLALAVFAPTLGSSGWVGLSICTMVFLMLADVPADGYSVELGWF